MEKFGVIVNDNKDLSRILQQIAFEEGFVWHGYDNGTRVRHVDKPVITFNCDTKGVRYLSISPIHSHCVKAGEIDLDGFRSMLNGEMPEPEIEYKGEQVLFGNKTVKIGDEIIPHEIIEKVYEYIQ